MPTTTAAGPVDPASPFRSATTSTDPAVRDAVAWHQAAHLLAARALGLAVLAVAYGAPCPPAGAGRDGALVAVAGPRGERWAPGWRERLVTIDCAGADPAAFGRHRHGLADEVDEVIGGHAHLLDALAVALEQDGELTPKSVDALWAAPRPVLRPAAEATEADAHALLAHLTAHQAAGDVTRAAAARRQLAALGYR